MEIKVGDRVRCIREGGLLMFEEEVPCRSTGTVTDVCKDQKGFADHAEVKWEGYDLMAVPSYFDEIEVI